MLLSKLFQGTHRQYNSVTARRLDGRLHTRKCIRSLVSAKTLSVGVIRGF